MPKKKRLGRPPKKQAQRKKAVEQYKEGLKIASILRLNGLVRVELYSALKAAKIELNRPPGPKPRKIDIEKVKKLKKILNIGEIADLNQMGHKAIRRRLKESEGT